MLGRKSVLLAGVFAGGLASSAYAADIKPAIIYDLGHKFDASFNEGVFHGAERFKKESGIDYLSLIHI